MNKQHYKAIAHALHDARVKAQTINGLGSDVPAIIAMATVNDLAKQIADALADSPDFNRHRFMSAVGIAD